MKLRKVFKKNMITLVINKKMINKKRRANIEVRWYRLKNKTIYFVQADTNVHWRPKKIKKDFNDSIGVAYIWLFAQAGNLKFNKEV